MLRVSDDHAGHAARTMPGAAELRLLVRLLRADEHGIARCLPAVEGGLDGLVATCSRHGLSVVLLGALRQRDLLDRVSPEGRTILDQRRRRQAERQRVLGRTLARVADLFDARGVPFVLLKGPYLARRLYGDALGREFVDLDLLVRRTDRRQACRLLTEDGFVLDSRTVLGSELTSLFVHGFDFTGREARIDLHWGLSRHPSLHVDEERLWSRRATYALDDRPFGVLSDEDEVVFAALSLLRDIERGRPKAKNVVDLIQIVAAIDAHAGWESLLARADGTRGPLVNVIGACLDLAAAHDLAPRLSAALAAHAGRRVAGAASDDPLRFRPTRHGLGNKLWSARAYDTSLPAWLVWWVVSLPFRVAVHRAPRRPRPPLAG